MTQSQTEMILADLKRGKKLTALAALDDYRCFRLAARIRDLRKEGHPIKSETYHDPMSGKHYARYWL